MEQASKNLKEAEVALEENNISKARDILESSQSVNPEDTEIMNLLGYCEYLFCNFDKAKYYWNKSISVKARDNKAVEYLLKYKADTAQDFQKLYKEAIRAEDQGDYTRAISVFKDLFEREPEMVGLLLHMGHCHFLNGSLDDAKEYMNKALLLDSSNEKALRYLDELSVLSVKKRKNPGKSLASFLILLVFLGVAGYSLSRALDFTAPKEPGEEVAKEEEPSVEEPEENPEPEAPVETPIETPVETPVVEEPEEETPVTEEPGPVTPGRVFSEDEVAVHDEALSDFRAGNYDRAAEAFHHILNNGEIPEYKSEAVFYLANTYQRQGKAEDAKRWYEEYLTRFPDGVYFEEVLYTYGLYLYDLGELENAKKVLQRIPNERPNSMYNNSRVRAILSES